MKERFTYDRLNRLDSIGLNSAPTGHMSYDALGRMTDKQSDGQQVFSSAQHDYVGPDGQLRPHAVSSAQVLGNPFPTEQLDIDYTMFDKVRRIADGIFSPTTVELEYGYDHQRTRMRVENPDDSRYGKTYVDGCEFVEHNGIVDMYTYLCGPLGVFAVNKLEVNGCHFVDRLHYVYKDHLGSWTTITDANGNVVCEQSFDAWGTMRDPDTWTGTVTQQPMFDRGFTGHEHLNSFGLINMNGRMYDPVMSSFLSVDNYVQAPDFSQSFNRYAYCLNNPLKYTDPSGEIHVLAVVAIVAAVTVITNGINNVRHGENFFHGAGQAAVTGGVQALFTYGIGESAGAIARDIMELGKSAAWANVAQAGFQIVSHGTVGGMSTMSRGGKFWHGFVSSATASVMSTAINQTCIHFQLSEGLTKTAMIAGGALSGGISAKMAGGEFIDGFCNGLICAGLNHALHWVVDGGGPLQQIRRRTQTITLKGVGILPGDSGNGFGTLHTATFKMEYNLSLSPDGKHAVLSVMSDHTHTNCSIIPIAHAELVVNGDVVRHLSLFPSQTGDLLPISEGCWAGWESLGQASFEVPEASQVRLNVYGSWNANMGCGLQPVMGINTEYAIPYPTGTRLSVSSSFYIKNDYGWSILNNYSK